MLHISDVVNGSPALLVGQRQEEGVVIMHGGLERIRLSSVGLGLDLDVLRHCHHHTNLV